MNDIAKLEDFGGMGQVSVNGRTVATVQYSLQVTQSMRDNGSGERIPGPKNIMGHISVIHWEAELTGLLVGTALMLKLKDGRTWPFAVQSGDSVSGYQCLSQGDFEK